MDHNADTIIQKWIIIQKWSKIQWWWIKIQEMDNNPEIDQNTKMAQSYLRNDQIQKWSKFQWWIISTYLIRFVYFLSSIGIQRPASSPNFVENPKGIKQASKQGNFS